MKIYIALTFVCGGFLAGLLLAHRIQPSKSTLCPHEMGRPEITSEPSKADFPRPASSEEACVKRPVIEEKSVPPSIQSIADSRDEAALSAWVAYYQAILKKENDHDRARQELLAAIDSAYVAQLIDSFGLLDELDETGRSLRLTEWEAEVGEGVESILEILGLPKGEGLASISKSRDLLVAEMQYGNNALSHDQRLAMLQLDRDRGTLLTEIFANAGYGSDPAKIIQDELEPWYEARLRGLIDGEQEGLNP